MMQEPEIPDVSQAYKLWDELFSFGLKLALSTSGDDPEEMVAARNRLREARRIALEERDAMWLRLVRCLNRASHGD